MTWAEVSDFIKTVGFPIAVTIYLLVRYEKRFVEMTKVLKDINDNMIKINTHMENIQ